MYLLVQVSCLASSALVFTAFAAAVNALRNNLNSVNADVLSLAHLAGFDIAISLVLGALVNSSYS